MKIPARVMVKEFQVMHKEHWDYVAGGSSKGKVDCSGAFVYVYKKNGKSIYHGSNRIAREYVVELIPYDVAKAKGLIVPGMAAFKIHKPGDAKYALGSTYKSGGKHYNGDLNDYYHIGLVDDDINYVLNAQGTSTGFKRSPITQNWTHVALLLDVDYDIINDDTTDNSNNDGGNISMGKSAIVTANSGTTVNMRSSNSTSSNIVYKVPIGSEVSIIEDHGDWCKIKYKNMTGWMVSNYLEYESAPVDSNNDLTLDVQELINIRSIAQNLLTSIDALINKSNTGVG